MPALGNILIKLDSVDSTNNYAMAQAHAGLAKHGMVYSTRDQTAGRGQRGKKWFTIAGENLIMTVVLEPDQTLHLNNFILSAAIAVACQEFFASYAGNDTKIKWPNDIYWRDRKAGGILIENIIQGEEWKYAIVGIGLNINQDRFDEGLKQPVSLRQITGKMWDVSELTRELCAVLESRYIEAIEAPDNLYQKYLEHLYKLNEVVTLRYDNIVFKTILKSVNKQGKLIVENAIKEDFNSGEVEWLINDF